MKQRELEYSNLLLNISNTILEYFKKYGFDSNKHQAPSSKEQQDIIVDEQEQFINVDNNKVELVSSQKENNNIIPLLIGGWLLYKILK